MRRRCVMSRDISRCRTRAHTPPRMPPSHIGSKTFQERLAWERSESEIKEKNLQILQKKKKNKSSNK